MAKKKKKDETPNPKIMNPKTVKKQIDNLNELPEGTTSYIPHEAVINVPISGSFRYAIEDTLHYVMSDMSSDEIIVAMYNIKTGYKHFKGETTQRDKALWTLMSLISEINYQAGDQKLTRSTNKPVNEELAGIINDMNTENDSEMQSVAKMRDYAQKYKDFHDKKSNEDSNQ